MKRTNAQILENRDVILAELDRQYQQEEKIRKDISERQNNDKVELANLQMDYAQLYLKHAKLLNSTFGGSFIALREELGAENSADLLQRMLDSSAQLSDSMAEFLDQMQRAVRLEIEAEGAITP